MEAAEAKIQRVLEGSKQFLVPHYQRPYSWRVDQWRALWRDLLELIEDPDSKPHFLGSIVTSPARSVPEGVEKRLLIDGQQRLTTLLVLLTLVRNLAKERGEGKLADRIQDLVTNRHEEGTEHYKLLPTQGEDSADSDRETFIGLVRGEPREGGSGIAEAYRFFSAKLRRADAPDLEAILRTITSKLTLVSIILDEKDNPHRIFESLNGKGRPLSQADLIRNYFFMRLHEKEHEWTYVDLWRPMQKRLSEEVLTDFVRHYLMRSGIVIRETDVYAALKSRVDEDTDRKPLDHLKELAQFSQYYEVLRDPNKAPSTAIRERLTRLNRLEVTVAYPLLLAVYGDFARGIRSEQDFCRVLDVLETYLVRRFICGVPTHGLNKVLAPVYQQASSSESFVDSVARILAKRNCPRDEEFRERISSARVYAGGERREKTKLILERIEAALGHKEMVRTEPLTIEHVMPQTLTDEWRQHLGESWEVDHEQFLHTLGNLTLTNYNAELSNSSFAEKKKLLRESHVGMNEYFDGMECWTASEIERRAEVLSDLMLSIWPYFGPQEVADATEAHESVTGTVPSLVRVRSEERPVQAWVDVAAETLEGIIRIGEEEFALVMQELPKFVNFDPAGFRRSSRLRRLSNGAFVETNLSASHIHRACLQAVEAAGLGPDDWHVTYASVAASESGEDGEAEQPSQAKQLQLEFWTQVREALQHTGSFPSLRTPSPQYWYDIAIGRSGFWLSLAANIVSGRVSVRIMFDSTIADRALEALTPLRAKIESEIGAPLEWNPYPEKRQKSIRLSLPANITDRSTWPAAQAWLVKLTCAFRTAFGPRVSDLELGPPRSA